MSLNFTEMAARLPQARYDFLMDLADETFGEGLEFDPYTQDYKIIPGEECYYTEGDPGVRKEADGTLWLDGDVYRDNRDKQIVFLAYMADQPLQEPEAE